jgi:NCAIR mutase (PurE)-related protein
VSLNINETGELERLLNGVASGEITPARAALSIKTAPFLDIGCAKIDSHRALRSGAGEVIFGQGKNAEQILSIIEAMIGGGRTNIIITRLDADKAETIAKTLTLNYDPQARLALAAPRETEKTGSVVVAAGGTSDIPVAQEAALTAEAMGGKVTRLYDVGVAGLHRLLDNLEPVMTARAVVAVAGMEGALPSVIGVLAGCPVVAVPTSVGYGASFGGVAALLAMLNSCASGVSVVNIDNGFGAGYLAALINRIGEK